MFSLLRAFARRCARCGSQLPASTDRDTVSTGRGDGDGDDEARGAVVVVVVVVEVVLVFEFVAVSWARGCVCCWSSRLFTKAVGVGVGA